MKLPKPPGNRFKSNIYLIAIIFYYINTVIVPDPKYCDPVQFRLPSKKMHQKGKIDVFEVKKCVDKQN